MGSRGSSRSNRPAVCAAVPSVRPEVPVTGQRRRGRRPRRHPVTTRDSPDAGGLVSAVLWLHPAGRPRPACPADEQACRGRGRGRGRGIRAIHPDGLASGDGPSPGRSTSVLSPHHVHAMCPPPRFHCCFVAPGPRDVSGSITCRRRRQARWLSGSASTVGDSPPGQGAGREVVRRRGAGPWPTRMTGAGRCARCARHRPPPGVLSARPLAPARPRSSGRRVRPTSDLAMRGRPGWPGPLRGAAGRCRRRR